MIGDFFAVRNLNSAISTDTLKMLDTVLINKIPEHSPPRLCHIPDCDSDNC